MTDVIARAETEDNLRRIRQFLWREDLPHDGDNEGEPPHDPETCRTCRATASWSPLNRMFLALLALAKRSQREADVLHRMLAAYHQARRDGTNEGVAISLVFSEWREAHAAGEEGGDE